MHNCVLIAESCSVVHKYVTDYLRYINKPLDEVTSHSYGFLLHARTHAHAAISSTQTIVRGPSTVTADWMPRWEHTHHRAQPDANFCSGVNKRGQRDRITTTSFQTTATHTSEDTGPEAKHDSLWYVGPDRFV